MKVHFIAIGGAVMHNLAIALHKKGYQVTGSDDEIFEPSKGRLEKHGLLPDKMGWDAGRIKPGLDTVILGMHAREGNPELDRAITLGIPVRSFPEYLFEQTENKKRVVIGGSHGKTTITSMIMHVLKLNNINFDYMVGSQIEGFETMVGLSDKSEIAVFEGDEYLSSALDKRPKFHLYKPHIALLSGIAWDHMNVFPSYENYLDQFELFIEQIEHNGTLVYFGEDPDLQKLVRYSKNQPDFVPYSVHPNSIRTGKTYLETSEGEIEVPIIGRHNMQNINGAKNVCNILGIPDDKFYKAISSFPGAKKRLQLLSQNENTSVYLDFAHAPSKVKATSSALKEQFPDHNQVAVLELHTYSSLNAEFLPQYRHTLNAADVGMVYFNPKTIEHKKLPALSLNQVKEAFGRSDLEVHNSADSLMEKLHKMDWTKRNLLIMTSGNFDGYDLEALARRIILKD
jgi:UDP-N-acetylmuramate: L-alanyl-gamma-D-glutamyl-meso-diaminopimelate ligase